MWPEYSRFVKGFVVRVLDLYATKSPKPLRPVKEIVQNFGK